MKRDTVKEMGLVIGSGLITTGVLTIVVSASPFVGAAAITSTLAMGGVGMIAGVGIIATATALLYKALKLASRVRITITK